MLVKLIKTTKEAVEIDVEFPIYRKQDVSGDTYDSVIFTRVEADREISIQKTVRWVDQHVVTWEVEIHSKPRLNAESLDWALGQGEYKSGAEEFSAALTELRKVVGDL